MSKNSSRLSSLLVLLVVLFWGVLTGPSCATSATESGVPSGDTAVSLLGGVHPPLRLDPAVKRQREAELQAARSRLAAYDGDRDSWIWVGRRLAYLGRFREALDVYSAALLRFPEDPRLLRHRGHRHLTLRELDAARDDLARAARAIATLPNEVEEDGLPNPRNEPRTTLHGNVWYHLGLAEYLLGHDAEALAAWDRARSIAGNDDAWVASAYWSVLASWRVGADPRPILAEVTPTMDLLENHTYHTLLLVFRGDVDAAPLRSAVLDPDAPGSVDLATLGYGLAAHALATGDPATGQSLCRAVLRSPAWNAFGYLAAEATLTHLPD